MKEEQYHTMRWVLFWVFLVMFILAGVGTLAMVFLGYGTSIGDERSTLVTILIGQTASSIIALFYFLFGMRRHSTTVGTTESALEYKEAVAKLSTELTEVKEKYNKLHSEKDALIAEIGMLRSLPDRIMGVLGAGESLTVKQIMERLQNVDLQAVQAILGKLVHGKIIEIDRSRPAGNYVMTRQK